MWHNLKLTFALGLFLLLTGQLTYSADGISRLGDELCDVKNVKVLWLHDVSGAMRFQLHFITEALTSLLYDLKQLSTSSDLAVSVFTDKPSTVGGKKDRGKCYKRLIKFGSIYSNVSDHLSIDKVSEYGSGGDKTEAQLLALLYGVMDNEVGWEQNNEPDLKVVILMTDNLYHMQGDSDHPPASIDGILRSCEEVDYPSFEILATAFKQKNAVIIFVVTENFNGEHADHVQQYITLARAMKVKYAIIDVGEGEYPEPTWLHENVKNRISDLACGKQYEGTTDGGTADRGTTDRDTTDRDTIEGGKIEGGKIEGGTTDKGKRDQGIHTVDEGIGDHITHTADVPITVVPSGGTPSFGYDLCGVENVQALWLQDVTTDIASQLPLVHNVLKGLQSDLKRVSSLSDLAISVFTDTPKTDTADLKLCYRPYSNFGNNEFSNNVDNLKELNMESGDDEKNSQLLALLYGVVDANIGWSTPRSTNAKVVILMTDGPYHVQGDKDSYRRRHNATVEYAKGYNCEKFDYPTIDVLVKAFKEKNAIAIFVVAHDFKSNHASIVNEYEKLSQAISAEGVRSTVIDVGRNTSISPPRLLDHVKKAISDLACRKTYGGKTDGGKTGGGTIEEGTIEEGTIEEAIQDKTHATNEGKTKIKSNRRRNLPTTCSLRH